VEVAGLDVPEMGIPGYPEFIPQRLPEDVPAAEIAGEVVAPAGKLVPST
jgi:hypothetical protein